MIGTSSLAKSEYISSLVFHTASRTIWNTNGEKYSDFGQIGVFVIVSIPHGCYSQLEDVSTFY